MEDKRTWDCVKSPSKQLLCTTLLLRTIFCSTLGSSRRPPTSPSNVVAKKSTHFHPFCSKFNFVWGGRGGVASFSNITGKVPTLLTSIVGVLITILPTHFGRVSRVPLFTSPQHPQTPAQYSKVGLIVDKKMALALCVVI